MQQRKNQVRAAHGTGEWATTNVNIQAGCDNDCRYCYAKAIAIRFHRATPESWSTPELNDGTVQKGYGKRSGTIMFPSTHDIAPVNIDACVVVLVKILAAGNRVLIVTKPQLACVKRLCLDLKGYKKQILFRFTICSADDNVLGFWEPGAPSFDERLQALKWAHAAGFKTSVSCEPMLDARIDRVIAAVKPYVTDAIWLGRANRLRHIVAVNCPDDDEVRRQTNKLIELQDDDRMRALYEQYREHPKVKFKDSIKKVVGLERPVTKGLDV
jgi:DNA repair photolyase